MPLITDKQQVLDIYAWAREKKWVVPTFCSENLTTTEAILEAARETGEKLGIEDIPVTIAVTNLYDHRSQTVNYTHSRCWHIGLQLFLKDLEVLCGEDSPYGKLKVMVHLDHIQPDVDTELLQWDMNQFSSIMFDASTRPFDENIRMTADFITQHGKEIVVEGACDEIIEASGDAAADLTTPEKARHYVDKTNADFIVANLGTEHRASAADLKYHSDVAREIKQQIGTRIVLHGCSSVPAEEIRHLFQDGVCKVNIWTALERDSSPALLRDMAANAAKVAGAKEAEKLLRENYLGTKADTASNASMAYCTTAYRQDIVCRRMKQIAADFFQMWYV